jgi:transposase
MSTRFVAIERDTPLLFPVDLRDWVEPDDPVHLVIKLVNLLPGGFFRVNERGTGSAQYPPSMMLALLIYCYSRGNFSSREIERATFRDVSVRYLTGDTHPDHDTIADFRARNRVAITRCFELALVYAKEVGLLNLGAISVDGTVLRANANRSKNFRYDELDELKAYIAQEVEKRLQAAEAADAREEDSDRLPPDLTDLRALEAKLEQARARIEERERERREHEQNSVRRSAGRPPKTPEQKERSRAKPVDPKPHACANRTDMDSRLMKDKKGGFDQCYNAQAVADADGSLLILAARVPDAAIDQFELGPDVNSVPAALGEPTAVLADCGYANIDHVQRLESKGKDVYISVRASHLSRGPNLPYPANPKPLSALAQSEFGQRMRAKLSTPEGKALYKRRQHSIEASFGIIKHVMGFRQFLLRGLDKVDLEWKLVTLAYNMKMIAAGLKRKKLLQPA